MFVPISIWTVVLLSCILTIHAAQKSVLLYSKVNQFQLVTSNTLVWQSYTDERDLEFAVRAAKYSSEKEGYNQYVCRVITEGIYVPGHTQNRDSHILCVVSMHTNVETHRTFDVLLNKGNGAKLSWKPWSKFSATIPTGAVSASDSSGHVDDNYVARRKSATHGEHLHHGVDYNVGRYAPKQSLGKVIVNVEEKEKEYDDGQILIEYEPIRYELRDIKIDKWRTHIVRNLTILGETILSNSEEYSNSVETAIGYTYDKVLYWGTYEGVARGLPTTVYETNKAPVQLDKGWGLKEVHKREETKQVSTSLQSGTALNVTLKGNYTKLEAPYKAILFSFYADTNESMSRRIEATVQTADMLDVKIEFSPVYWQHNFSLVPTTTTTTTTTTSTTTEVPTSTTNRSNSLSVGDRFGDGIVDSNDIAVDEIRDSATENQHKLHSSKGSENSNGAATDRSSANVGASPSSGRRLDSSASVITSFCGTTLLILVCNRFV